MSECNTLSEPRQPQVAVALASRNGARYIRQQIISILWQEGCRTSVFVRDDGSSDDTVDIILDLAKEFPGRVQLVEDDRGQSGSAAQNFFLLLLWLQEIDKDFVALADQDDIWEGQKLARAISVLDAKRADGYSSNLIAFSDHGAPQLIRKSRPAVEFDHLFQTASAGCTYVLTGRLFDLTAKKLAAEKVLVDVAHDIVVYALARSHGFRWVHDNNAHILYRQHEDNLVGSRVGVAGMAARWKLVRSGWYRRQTLGLAPFLAGSNEEKRIMKALSRNSLFDRIWLASRAFSFRRRRREALAFAAIQLFS